MSPSSFLSGAFLFGRLTFNHRLEQLRPRLYRLAFSWCKESYLAEDLVQETMIRALQKQTQLRDEELMDRWVIRILANQWLDHVRNRVHDDNIDDVEQTLSIDEQQSPECIHCRDEMIERVRNAVMRLPEMQRMVVTLVDLEEFSYKEVATTLDLPIGTIMSRLSRGRQSLRKLLIETKNAATEERSKSECHLRRVV